MCYHAQFTCSFTCSSKPNEKSQIYCYENSHSCFVNNVISSFHIINLKTVIVQQMSINYSSKLLNSHFAKIMSSVKKTPPQIKVHVIILVITLVDIKTRFQLLITLRYPYTEEN